VWNNVRQLNLLASMLYALAAGVLLACAALWLIGRPMFTLRAIDIDGDVAHINVPTVRANLTGHMQGNFFTTVQASDEFGRTGWPSRWKNISPRQRGGATSW